MTTCKVCWLPHTASQIHKIHPIHYTHVHVPYTYTVLASSLSMAYAHTVLLACKFSALGQAQTKADHVDNTNVCLQKWLALSSGAIQHTHTHTE